MKEKLNEVVERFNYMGYEVKSSRIGKDEKGWLGHITIKSTWISGNSLHYIEMYFEIHGIRINSQFGLITITITNKGY